MSTDWFAVRTRSRAEKVVNQQLLRKQIDVFLPTITRWSRWKDRKKAVDWPLFPGYCFARFEPEQSLAILSCTGVAGIVSFGDEPAPIPHHEIEGIRLLVSSKLQYDPVPFIKEGDPVVVVSGPLKGARGRLVKKGQKARLLLAIDLIGRMVSAEVDAADVRLG